MYSQNGIQFVFHIFNFLQRGTQKISTTCRILVGCFLLLILDRLYLAIFGTVSWLDWLYFLSMVKIGITLLKYIPQAHFNYQRQSTRGWTIGTVLLDLLGGTFSLAQMFINAWNHGIFLLISYNLSYYVYGNDLKKNLNFSQPLNCGSHTYYFLGHASVPSVLGQYG